jgi:hypothetical protein
MAQRDATPKVRSNDEYALPGVARLNMGRCLHLGNWDSNGRSAVHHRVLAEQDYFAGGACQSHP